MNVNSATSTYGFLLTQPSLHKSEAAEVQRNGRANDQDADNTQTMAVTPAVSPSVNSNGQTVGQVIDIKA